MPKLGEAFVVIRAALGPLKSGLAAAKSAVTKAMSAVTGTIKKAMAVTYKWVKRAMLAISGAILTSIYAFSKFSEQMANVSTMLDEQTMRYMPRYSKAIKQMAVDFGEGTASLSKGLYDILSASIAPAKALEVLGVAARAAKAGLTTTAVAADAITTILNAYGLSADKAGNVSDILFATVKRGKLTFEELAQSVGKVAATASVAGLSFEEVSAAIATMTRSGLNAFLATTALRSIMSGFLKPMESAKKAAAELGIELNSTTLKTIGLTGVLEKLKGASAEQLAALIPNRRALAGFSAMVKNTSGQVYDLNLMLNSAGLTQKAYEKMTNTLKFSLDKLKQSFVILATTIGSALAPAFKLLTDITVGSVKKSIDYLEKHKFEIMRWSAVVATRINFIRGVLQDFIVGAYKNWPETWKFMKDAAVGQLDVIWKSFNLHIGTALQIATSLFIAFGKSLYHIFEKAFMDIGTSVVTWLFNANQIRAARKFVMKNILEKEGISISKLGAITGEGFTKQELDAKVKEARKEAFRIVDRYGPEGSGFNRREAFVGSWDPVIKKVKSEFVPVLAEAKEKLAEVRAAIVDMEKEFAKGIKLPGFVEASVEKRLKEMKRLETKLLKDIKDREWYAKWGHMIGGRPTGKAGADGKPGADGKDGVAGQLRFSGFKEAWNRMAQSLQPKDKVQESILQEQKKANIELKTQTAYLKTIPKIVTIGP
jgi:TP901 family phage tail tape measure protein